MHHKTSYAIAPVVTPSDAPMDAYSVRLTPWHARIARRAGATNFSEGVRIALEQWHARQKKEKDFP